jgi:hypothetical protein
VRVGGPEALPQFLAGHNLTRLVQKRDQDLIYLPLQLKARTIPGYFLPLLINLKWTETHKTRT